MKGASATSRLTATRFRDVRWVDETGSTNADLLDAAAEGAEEGLVLVAEHQRAGRGRLDRTWEAPPGSSLLVSVLLRPRLAVADAHLVTSATALAAIDACHAVAGIRPGLKWPNDLVAVAGDRHAGKKLGGILAESRLDGAEVEALVVGMGLNVNWPVDLPAELVDVATSVNHVVGHDVDREDLLVAWLERLDGRLDELTTAEGRARLDAAVRSASATLGRSVRVELPDGSHVEGRAVDVDPDGRLVVDRDDGDDVLRVSVGDVVHLRHRA
ncbi:MAG: biotin--[acetyl-CoA-carboxylase] ligase [Acidimicrobiales bacterium]|nr:biotin--[acetyl-CoA-carboxylase] ligase [Acidimicrobiales bacterium]